MNSAKKKWILIGVLNLLLVSILGSIMRYKIGFDFPWFSQKYIQHAHSHFAFAGWIGHMLFVFIVFFLKEQGVIQSLGRFKWIIYANLLIAYAMLVSFFLEGYGTISIVFSTASILVNYWFAFAYYTTIRRSGNVHPSIKWFNAALVFNILSSIGTFYLAYMMATKTITQNWYLGSVYFFLHFQYNGWFFFAIMGLVFHQFKSLGIDIKASDSIFKLMVWSAFPSFLLSVLWLKMPIWLLILGAIAAIVQTTAWVKFVRMVVDVWSRLSAYYTGFVGKILLFAGVAVSIKFILQLGSTIPAVSQYAFGFRSIVIAYLHLVLLAFVTVFLLAYVFAAKYVALRNSTRNALFIFLAGVLLNELILLLQGVGSFTYTLVPFANEGLFSVAILMNVGLIYLIIGLMQSRRE